MDSSYVDLADPTHLEFAYLRWMRIALRAAGARRVLHVGGGACALARALAAEDPGGRQLVCEVDAGVLALAREHLGLRRQPGLRVRHAEGRACIAGQADKSWDAVVIDAFIDATVPRSLITVEALGDAARVSPLTLINVVDDHAGNELRTVAAGLAEVYPQVWSVGAPSGNIVLAGDAANVDTDRVATQAAADSAPAWLTPPGTIARLISGTSPLRDEDP
jgi:spermidine synthase